MSVAQIAVTLAGAAAGVWVLWYFLWSRRAGAAAAPGAGVQEIRVTVKGGYTPDTILVEAGRPVRLLFYRDETADCSERVVFEAFGVNQQLPAFQTTPVQFTPREPGEFPFRCGMNMLKGLLVVEAPGARKKTGGSPHKFHG